MSDWAATLYLTFIIDQTGMNVSPTTIMICLFEINWILQSLRIISSTMLHIHWLAFGFMLEPFDFLNNFWNISFSFEFFLSTNISCYDIFGNGTFIFRWFPIWIFVTTWIIYNKFLLYWINLFCRRINMSFENNNILVF